MDNFNVTDHEFINFQDPFYGLSVEEAANFAGEKNISKKNTRTRIRRTI
jgi:hypothetical protein